MTDTQTIEHALAAHSGYQSMDDQLLWTAVTRNVPDMIERLRSAASRG